AVEPDDARLRLANWRPWDRRCPSGCESEAEPRVGAFHGGALVGLHKSFPAAGASRDLAFSTWKTTHGGLTATIRSVSRKCLPSNRLRLVCNDKGGSVEREGGPMFTGLVEAMGTVRDLRDTGAGRRLVVAHPFGPVALGDSVAVNGACLTVVES